jgi:DNA polymerase
MIYNGWNSNYLVGPIGWAELQTYGGKLVENIVQATSRDLMVNGMLNVNYTGYPIVLHTHDEPVSEVPAGVGIVQQYEDLMCITPAWAAGWPIKASGGWRGKRYRKE